MTGEVFTSAGLTCRTVLALPGLSRRRESVCGMRGSLADRWLSGTHTCPASVAARELDRLTEQNREAADAQVLKH